MRPSVAETIHLYFIPFSFRHKRTRQANIQRHKWTNICDAGFLEPSSHRRTTPLVPTSILLTD